MEKRRIRQNDADPSKLDPEHTASTDNTDQEFAGKLQLVSMKTSSLL